MLREPAQVGADLPVMAEGTAEQPQAGVVRAMKVLRAQAELSDTGRC